MKNIKKVLFTAGCMMAFVASVKAAPSYSFNVSQGTIENGRTVTASVTVRNTAAWNIKITSSGNTYGCSNAWADATSNGNDTTKTFSTTCKASSLGTIAFTISGDITSSDGSNIGVSGGKSVNVVEPRPASTVNKLTSIKVEGYEISPEFNEDTLEYSVDVPSTINSIKISTAKKDSRSSVEGDGEKEVSEGSNRFEIVVTAESGAKNVYIVVVNVKDENPISAKVDGKDFTIVKNSKNLEIPEGFVEEKITINGTEVPSFKNELNKIVLVALKDNSGSVGFYEYDNGNYSKYVVLNSVNLSVYPQESDGITYKGFSKTTINIGGEEVTAYKYKNLNNYYLVYGMDLSTGKNNYYLYDVNNNTFQVFNEELFNSLIDDSNFYLYGLIGALGVVLVCIIIIIILAKSKSKRKIIKNEIIEKPITEKKEKKEKIKKENKKESTILDDDFFDDIKK